AGHVPGDPEFLLGEIPIADTDVPLDVIVDDGRQLLHREALRDPTADLCDVGDNAARVDGRRIDDKVLNGHGIVPELSVVNRPWSVAACATDINNGRRATDNRPQSRIRSSPVGGGSCAGGYTRGACRDWLS